MAPNLLSNTPSCRVKAEFLPERTKSPEPAIRIENVAHHVFCDLLAPNFFRTKPTVNEKERAVVDAFKRLTDDFKLFSGDSMTEMVSTLDYTPETIDEVFLGIANELFCEGITWSRIAAYTVFAGELASQCLENDQPTFVVDAIFGLYIKLIKDSLEKWIFDHGGWEAFVEFSKKNMLKETETDCSGSSNSVAQRTSGWARSALNNTVRVLGTLAYFANIGDLPDTFSIKKC